MKFMKKNNKNKGFTLIEVIVVLVIIVIMAAIAVPAVTGYISDARNSQYVQEVRAMYTVIQAEEAKAEAKNESPNYTDIAKAVLDNLGDDSNISNLTITGPSSNDGKYKIEYTSGGTQTVTAEFTENSDDMTIETDAAKNSN